MIAFTPQTWAGESLLQWDNDKVADTDRHYTNGIRIAYRANTPDSPIQATADWLMDHTWFVPGGERRIGWSFGQNMYTPEDISRTTPDPTDRPYAGWTYIGTFAQSESAQGWTDWDQEDTVEIDIGFVGPPARGEAVQNWFHSRINVGQARGWDSQVGAEPGILLTRTLKLRSPAYKPLAQDWVELDIVPHTTAKLGNIKTAGTVGATLRLGQNLKDNFGPIYGTFALPAPAIKTPSWSAFVGGEAQYVAYDIFLDGNTTRSSPSVKRTALVFESRMGISLHLPFAHQWSFASNWPISGARIDIVHVEKTHEFKAQHKNDRYGSLQLTLTY